jgi:hypothetical protein
MTDRPQFVVGDSTVQKADVQHSRLARASG